ncbi:hypothetical protein JOC85_001020 [Bacillus mesophilus]|uniref:Uncharacterized protein n=1 Tax=Bacillus mesophilus TaxID=1808955 RepID=A0A6M0Q646_9BACI|nr:hypothetical protein [Bacillus mesophilus]MBM7660253.1 hypothetical protein [Bacillus mesophilus]NEY70970.1 hypothetical protein [Bacillus mesophilus]
MKNAKLYNFISDELLSDFYYYIKKKVKEGNGFALQRTLRRELLIIRSVAEIRGLSLFELSMKRHGK